MKRLIIFLVILGIGLGVWWKYSSYVKSIEESVQGDPTRTVNAFMNTVTKLSGLIWNEEEREALLSDIKKWQSAEEGEEEIPESLKEYGIENPAPLFKEGEFGKVVASSICLFHFESFSVEETEIEGSNATVEVKFLPLDILGIGKIAAKLGAPQRQRKKEPVSVLFYLERHWRRWYIVGIGGELEKLAKASYRLRKLR